VDLSPRADCLPMTISSEATRASSLAEKACIGTSTLMELNFARSS